MVSKLLCCIAARRSNFWARNSTTTMYVCSNSDFSYSIQNTKKRKHHYLSSSESAFHSAVAYLRGKQARPGEIALNHAQSIWKATQLHLFRHEQKRPGPKRVQLYSPWECIDAVSMKNDQSRMFWHIWVHDKWMVNTLLPIQIPNRYTFCHLDKLSFRKHKMKIGDLQSSR